MARVKAQFKPTLLTPLHFADGKGAVRSCHFPLTFQPLSPSIATLAP